METRIARLEADVGHVRSDVSKLNVKVDGVRDELSEKIDRVRDELSAKIDRLNAHLTDRIDSVRKELDAKIDRVGERIGRLEEKINTAMIWALLLYIALAAGTYTTMARAFGWL